MMSSSTEKALSSWVAEQFLANAMPLPSDLKLSSLNGDAGFRCYYRVNSEPSVLAVYAPPAHEKNEDFVAIAKQLVEHGVAAPRVLAVDFAQGYLLIEDFGDELLYQHLVSCGYADYHDAFETLVAIQKTAVVLDATTVLPDYSARLLEDEMNLFDAWFLPQLLQCDISVMERDMLCRFRDELIAVALQQPRVFVHRDYHCRNLVVRSGQSLGVIDFQDAVTGPITYDLVSLLKDCYIRWPAEKVQQMALDYRARAIAEGLMPEVDEVEWLLWFDAMGLQRHIKVLGIFARLWLRDGKPGYLNDLPLVMRYVLEACDRYPRWHHISQWFRDRVLPLCEQATWYQPVATAGDVRV